MNLLNLLSLNLLKAVKIRLGQFMGNVSCMSTQNKVVEMFPIADNVVFIFTIGNHCYSGGRIINHCLRNKSQNRPSPWS